MNVAVVIVVPPGAHLPAWLNPWLPALAVLAGLALIGLLVLLCWMVRDLIRDH